VTLHVHTGGSASVAGPPVVFLHGAGVDHTVWRFQTRRLAHQGYRVLAPDLPGHGRSGGEPCASMPDWAEWLVSFLDERVGGPATVVGHSMGGLIAMHAAALAPQQFQRLVVVGSGRSMPVHADLLDAARHDLPRAAALIAGWSMPGAARGGHPEPGTWQQGGIERLVERGRPGVLAIDLEACAGCQVPVEAIRVPTDVIMGSQDRMAGRRAGEELTAAIPGSSLHVIEGAGHDAMVQVPRTFNRMLISLFDV
jgi:pimeloyl-ACP methyl ester carboxylesterase